MIEALTSHALGAHLLGHDLSAVQCLETSVREAVGDAEELVNA